MDSAESGRRSSAFRRPLLGQLGLDSGDNTSKARRKQCVMLKRNFRRYARTRSSAAKTRAFGANVPHSPLASRVNAYFTAHAISGFKARFFNARHWNGRPVCAICRLDRRDNVARSVQNRVRNRTTTSVADGAKRSGVRMIATCAGSKAKALLPSGWFQRGKMGFGAGIPVGILGDAANVEPAVSIEATLRLLDQESRERSPCSVPLRSSAPIQIR